MLPALFDDRCDSMSLMNRLNRSGLRLHPCLTPLEQENKEESLFFTATLEDALVYIDSGILIIFVLTPKVVGD